MAKNGFRLKSLNYKAYFCPMFFLKLISRLPLPVLYFICDFVRIVLFYLLKYRVRVVRSNLNNAFPEKSPAEIEKIIQKFYRNLSDIIAESIKCISIRKEDLEKRISFESEEIPLSYLDNGRTILVLTGHLCNWEWLLLACSIRYNYPIDAIYKPLHNPKWEELFYKTRSKFGAKPIAMKDTLREMVRRKDIVRGIAMVADQTPPHGEIQYWTNFLNQNTPFFVGADKMAKKGNFPVIFAGMKRTGRGKYTIYFKEIARPPYEGEEEFSLIKKYAETLEESIREAPENWLWSHKRWKHKQPKKVVSDKL
ncbi:MAG TPA: lysophospholipid acyltransferase family protein [Cytophagaceae bacterium]